MFSGIYSAVSKLVGSQPSEANDEDEPSPLAFPSAEKEEASYPSAYSFHEDDEPSSIVFDPKNRKTVQGKVTQLLSSGYGLIDNDIVFTYDAVVGKERPREGTKVQVEAYREHAAGGWKAKQVSLILDWNLDPSKEDPVEKQIIVGTVSKILPKSCEGFINETIAFDQDALAHGFKPCRGDWVEAELHTNPETQQNFAKNVTPLRQRKFVGIVTHSYPGYGYIDNKIYFVFANCENGYRPQKGDPVEGKAIESDQSKGRWRAIQVAAKKVYKRQHRATESPLQSQRMQELERNKQGIVISSNLRLGSIVIDETKTIQVSIKNVGSNEHILKSCDACSLSASISVKIYRSNATLENNPQNKPYVLPAAVPPMSSRIAVLSVTASQLGRTSFQVIFDFGDFQIGRTVTMTVEDPQTLVLTPSSAGSPTRGKGNRRDRLKGMYSESKSSEGWVVPGRRVMRNYDLNVPVKLGRFIVPKDLEQAVLMNDDVTICYPELNQGLNMENYSIRFSTLLHLEEIQMSIDMKQFDLERVSMKPRHGEYLALDVPGLAEGRPSVMLGDKIILSLPNADRYSTKYEGVVHEVLSDTVLLKFNEKFQESYQAEEYNVSFTFSRTSLRRCHQAADFSRNLGTQVVFPTKVEARPPQLDITYRTQTNIINISWPRIPSKIPRVTSPEPTQQSPNPTQQSLHPTQQYLRPTQQPLHPTQQSPHQRTPPRPIRSNSMDGFHTPKMDPKFEISTPKMEVKFLTPKISGGTGQGVNVKQAKTSDGRLVANFFNPKLNVRQKAAVVRVLQGEGRPTPYIIFGPPGTGKTVTVVEAILQVHQHMPSSRVLACTPSNSAADLLTERLHLSGYVKQHEMIRLNGFSRSDESIPDVIRPYCRDGEDLEKISHYRMLICTCATSGSFYQLGLKAGHFTHVFVDEAGQATEPECMVPAGLACGAEGQIILAGDPMQLGPVLNCDISKDYGLDLSLLERLTKRPLYRRDAKKFRDHGNYDPLLVTKLVENYRSHPVLLELSSDIFYHGELEPQGDSTITSCLCDWEMLPNKTDCPLIFHGIKGEDMREGNSPSWFNPMEVVQVAKYLKSLLAIGEPVLKTSDIGVITPYRKQVEKIRLLMTTLDIHGVKVGSVEEFQGQERLVMIISTVRSSEDLVDFDVRHHLGFVSNPKRFNVSITRAQALQIIVGNPHVLAMDRYWRALLRYCVDHRAYIGCDLPELVKEVIEEGDLDRVDDELPELVEEIIEEGDLDMVDDGLENKCVQSGDTQVEDNTESSNAKRSGEKPKAEVTSPSQAEQGYGDLVKAFNDEFQHLESQETLDIKAQPVSDDKIRTTVEQSRPVDDVSTEDIVQSTVRSTENATAAFNSPVQQCQSIKETATSQATESQIPPLDYIEEDSQETPPVIQEKDFKRLYSPIDSLDSGICSDQTQESKEVIVIGPDTQSSSFSSSASYSSEGSMSPSCRSEQSVSSISSSNQNVSNIPDLDSDHMRSELPPGGNLHSQTVFATNESKKARNEAKSDLSSNQNQRAKEETQFYNSQQIHQNRIIKRTTPPLLSLESQKQKESKQCVQPRKGKPGKGSPHIVVAKESEADRRNRENVLKTLYPQASTSSNEDDQMTSFNSGVFTNSQTPSSMTASDAGASCQSPKSSEASDLSVHLSDDSGPEEFQDYTPTKSSSENSIDEKSPQRGWYTAAEVIRKPLHHHHHHHQRQKQSNVFKSLEARAPGRGSPYQPRDRSGYTPGRQNNPSGHRSQFPKRDNQDRGHSSQGSQSSYTSRNQPNYNNRKQTNHTDSRNESNYRDQNRTDHRDRYPLNPRDRQDQTVQGKVHQSHQRGQAGNSTSRPADQPNRRDRYDNQRDSKDHPFQGKGHLSHQREQASSSTSASRHADQSNRRDRYDHHRERQDQTFQEKGHNQREQAGHSTSKPADQSSRRDRYDETPKDYYIGLGRGRGRPMQMAAQLQDTDSASRPYSYSRGLNFSKR